MKRGDDDRGYSKEGCKAHRWTIRNLYVSVQYKMYNDLLVFCRYISGVCFFKSVTTAVDIILQVMLSTLGLIPSRECRGNA